MHHCLFFAGCIATVALFALFVVVDTLSLGLFRVVGAFSTIFLVCFRGTRGPFPRLETGSTTAATVVCSGTPLTVVLVGSLGCPGAPVTVVLVGSFGCSGAPVGMLSASSTVFSSLGSLIGVDRRCIIAST